MDAVTTPMLAWGHASAADLLIGLLGEPVTVRHLCPACGSTSHGRPWTMLRDGRRPDISVSHAGALTLVGATWHGRVGVDVEPATGTPPPGIRHPADPPASLELWLRKEAYLKATGDGLRRDPGTVSPAEPHATWGSVTAPTGHVAAWCLIHPTG